jgi:membrane-associated phospholipid phosphatase
MPVVLALSLCPLAAVLTPAPAAPLERMTDLIDAERSLGLLFEPAVHRWAVAHPPLQALGDLAYVGVHLPVTLGVLAWVWRRRPRAFPLVRDTFVATQILCVLGYLALPTAPPRMLAGLHDGDAAVSGFDRIFQSPYAAMPSGHVAFALVVASAVAVLARARAVRALALLYPAAVLAEIVATGNHLWLDAAGGALAAALGFALALTRTARARPPEVQLEAVT